MKITIHVSESGNKFLTVRDNDDNRVYFNDAKGRTSYLQIPDQKKYPGYLEWVIERISNGSRQAPTISEWRAFNG